MKRDDFPAPRQGILLTHFRTVEDVPRSRAFYADILGGQVVRPENPCIIKLANSWVILNPGGGPTDDKPDVTLAPPTDLERTDGFARNRRSRFWRSTGCTSSVGS